MTYNKNAYNVQMLTIQMMLTITGRLWILVSLQKITECSKCLRALKSIYTYSALIIYHRF